MRSRDERGQAGSALASVATALAVLAVLAVLATATAAGVSYRAEEAPPADPTTAAPDPTTDPTEDPPEERLFPDGQLVTGDRRDNAQVEVPSVEAGWTLFTGTIGYESEDGEASAGVADPFFLDRGHCTSEAEGDADRASLGLTAPVSGLSGDDAARQGAEQTVDRYLPAVFDRDEARYPDVEYRDTEVADGTPAVSASFEYEITRDRNRCTPPAVEMTFLAFPTGDYVAVVVLRRDIELGGGDLADGLSAEDADRILATARPVT